MIGIQAAFVFIADQIAVYDDAAYLATVGDPCHLKQRRIDFCGRFDTIAVNFARLL